MDDRTQSHEVAPWERVDSQTRHRVTSIDARRAIERKLARERRQMSTAKVLAILFVLIIILVELQHLGGGR